MSSLALRPSCELPQNFNSLNVSLTSATVISLTWSQPADDGRCVILSYQVMVDDGAMGPFTPYGSLLTASTFTIDVTALNLSLNYRFMV